MGELFSIMIVNENLQNIKDVRWHRVASCHLARVLGCAEKRLSPVGESVDTNMAKLLCKKVDV